MSSHAFRDLTQFERELLGRLLDIAEENQTNRDATLLHELRAQASASRVRTYEDSYGSFEFELPFSPPFDDLRMIVDAFANDEDGVPIDALLFVANGRLREVEIVRLDGLPLKKMPAAGDFEDYAHYVVRHGIGQAES